MEPKRFPAALERAAVSAAAVSAAAVSVEERSERNKLFACLKAFRNMLAAEKRLAPYMIFSEELVTQLAVNDVKNVVGNGYLTRETLPRLGSSTCIAGIFDQAWHGKS
jgi:hypothetical protein